MNLFLVGLKSDLYHSVNRHEGMRVAASLGAEYWECSAQTAENTTRLFDRAATASFETSLANYASRHGNWTAGPHTNGSEEPKKAMLNGPGALDKNENKRKGCCSS